MRCEDAREQLSEARYGGAQPAALEEHLAGCSECRAAQAAQLALDGWLANDESAVARPGFDTAFFARLEQERAEAQRRRWTRLGFLLLPVAAAVALVVLRQAAPDAPAPEAALPPELAREDLELAVDLELVEDLEVVQHIDELEAFDTLADVDEDELEALLENAP